MAGFRVDNFFKKLCLIRGLQICFYQTFMDFISIKKIQRGLQVLIYISEINELQIPKLPETKLVTSPDSAQHHTDFISLS